MGRHQRTTFLTGSTGFIGQYVLRGLLQRDRRVVVLLREAKPQAHDRLAQIMSALGVDVPRRVRDGQLIISEGTLPHDVPSLAMGSIDEIVHSAACLQVAAADPGEPFLTNFEGAKALAEWAEAHDVDGFYFVSTAYTCGRDAGFAVEELHRFRPQFVTDYELSKWLAEQYLAQWARRTNRRLTILRPSLVIGDSVTGRTSQFGGFYQLARVVHLLAHSFKDQRTNGRLYLPIRIPADPQGRQNLVPVDFVARAIVEIVTRPQLGGKVYHLTNPSPPTNGQIRDWLEEFYQLRGGHFVDDVEPQAGESLAESMFLRMNDLVLQQFKFVPEFDCSNTLEALRGTDIAFPELNQQKVFRLLEYAAAHNWGRLAKAAAS